MTLGITDPHNAGEVAENKSDRGGCAGGTHSSAVWFVIQKELRRFGYRVSKENFLFLVWTTHRCLTPPASEYFVARPDGGRGFRRAETALLQSIRSNFNRFVATHKAT
jgi:hypothetical protein